MEPLAGSPAIDRVPGSAPGDFPPADQRGVSRPQGARADSGAVELELLSPSGLGFGPQGGSAVVRVAAEGAWIAATDAPSWVSIADGTGTGRGILSFRVARHDGSGVRSATLRIGGGSVTIVQAGDFPDVPPEHPFHDAIGSLRALGAASECGDERFCPDDPISRADAAEALGRVTGAPAYDAAGLADGSSPGPLTRRAIEKFLSRTMPASSDPWDDQASRPCRNPSSPRGPEIEKAGSERLCDGMAEPLTRSEFAGIIVGALEAQASAALSRMPIVRPDPAARPLPLLLPVRGLPPSPTCEGN
jgi:hypothetical protein